MASLPVLMWLAATSTASQDPAPGDGCTDDLTVYVDAISTEGLQSAYLCLAAREDAGAFLLELAQALGGSEGRQKRARIQAQQAEERAEAAARAGPPPGPQGGPPGGQGGPPPQGAQGGPPPEGAQGGPPPEGAQGGPPPEGAGAKGLLPESQHADEPELTDLEREIDALEASVRERRHKATTRALAIYMLERADSAYSADQARALNAADRRLLMDGIRARRGRRSPAPDHDRVFTQFPWYQPTSGYNDGRLSEQDRANIALLSDPPEALEPVDAALSAMPEHNGAVDAKRCGCAASGGSPAWLGLLLMAALRRRRSGQAPP